MTEPKKFPYEVKVGGSIITIYRNTERRKKADGTVAQYPYFIVQHYEGVTRVRDRCATWEEVSKSVDEMKEKLKAQDIEALRLTGRDRRVYLAVIERLRDCGISPEDATKEYADAVKVLAPFKLTVPIAIQQWVDAAKQLNGVPLFNAVAFFVRHGQSVLVVKTVPEIVAELIVEKTADQRGHYHLRDLKTRLGRFSKAFPGKILDVTTDQINQWLRNLRSESQHLKKQGKVEIVKAKTRHNYRGDVVELFRFARTKGYLPRDLKTAAEMTEVVKVVPSPNLIFPATEMEKLLEYVPARLVPAIAIKAFSGVRTEEMSKINWEKILFSQNSIVLDADVTKLSLRRTIKIKPNLKAWLQPFRGSKGRICARWSTAQSAFQAWDKWARKLSMRLGRNKLRNSFISFRVAEKGDFKTTAYESGNSEEEIKRDYMEVATSYQARKWFSIRPSAAKQQELRQYAQELLAKQAVQPEGK